MSFSETRSFYYQPSPKRITLQTPFYKLIHPCSTQKLRRQKDLAERSLTFPAPQALIKLQKTRKSSNRSKFEPIFAIFSTKFHDFEANCFRNGNRICLRPPTEHVPHTGRHADFSEQFHAVNRHCFRNSGNVVPKHRHVQPLTVIIKCAVF